ncbi:MAG: efflux RND transporter periplasmic adaptor subunit [Deltaproteobacteria bacterium]|jgi:membrane fusion protein (multidrug efflux system)|nr:efflux RND transporter periplasmic adaptor subunit [Deltaproteobacteria bacterium]
MKMLLQPASRFFVLSVCAAAVCACSSERKIAPQVPAPLVRVVTLERRDVPLTEQYVGQTVGSLSVQVRAQVSGILKKRNYKEGDFVQQGQLLFEIDPDTYRAALEQAKGREAQAAAALDRAKREWDRIQSLYARNAVSQRDRDLAETSYDGAKADMEAAKASVAEAQIKLDHAYVTAPISGHTSKESRSEGNLVSATGESSLLTEINQIDPIFVDFSIPSTQYQSVRQMVASGQAIEIPPLSATIRFADGGDYPHQGEITFIDTRIDVSTSVVKARAVFSNPDRIILPGLFVRLKSGGITLKDALLIPQTAMIQTQQGTVAMILDDQALPQSRAIRLGWGIGNDFVVLDGLKSGERIISDGVNKIRPGRPVRIDDGAAPASQAPAPQEAGK